MPDIKIHTAGSRRLVHGQFFDLTEFNGQTLTIGEVCRSAGGRWRTLDYAFRETFGVGPKTYLQAVRLNRVRTDLLAAAPFTRIKDVANRWGFRHMGQFAPDHRQLFDELPSDTLKRSCRRQSGPAACI